MNVITQVTRIIVGTLFIFSGLVKLNDPMGFGFKLEEYFAPDVLNLPVLIPFALEFALFVVIFEILLGAALLLGYRVKLTLGLLLAMIVFFSFLTFYSAYFDKVTDCGCFGDAIPLTPWQSFGKDIIFLVLILILYAGKRFIQPWANHPTQIATLAFVLLASGYFGFYVLNHLPVKDFRPYAIGKSIPDGMKLAEELGLEGPVYETIFVMKNSATGQTTEVTSTEYSNERWWEKTDWKILEDQTRSKKVKEGYEPPIHDFSVSTEQGDITEEVLAAEEYLLVVSYRLNKSSLPGFKKIAALGWEIEKSGLNIPVIALTATGSEEADVFRHEIQAPFDFASTDETTLKTMIRSNPGLIYIRKGVVRMMWHHNDVPSLDELSELRR